MADTVVYGGLLALLGPSLPASAAAAVAIAGGIGWTWVRLGLHAVPEALAGPLHGRRLPAEAVSP